MFACKREKRIAFCMCKVSPLHAKFRMTLEFDAIRTVNAFRYRCLFNHPATGRILPCMLPQHFRPVCFGCLEVLTSRVFLFHDLGELGKESVQQLDVVVGDQLLGNCSLVFFRRVRCTLESNLVVVTDQLASLIASGVLCAIATRNVVTSLSEL